MMPKKELLVTSGTQRCLRCHFFCTGRNYLSSFMTLIPLKIVISGTIMCCLTFVSFIMTSDNIYTLESLEDYFFDEDYMPDDEYYNDYLYPIAINTASYEELKSISLLSEENIYSIIRARNQREITGEEDLYRIGIAEAVVRKFIAYITFDVESSVSFRQRVRYIQKDYNNGAAYSYHQHSELHYGSFQVGFASTSDSLQNVITANNSYYAFYKGDKIVRQAAIGKYRLYLGQGVAYAPAFGISKSSAVVTQPIKNYTPLRPHTSPYNSWSLEGVALHLRKGNVALIPFFSETKLHARLEDDKIRTIYPFGEHRKEHENNVSERITGLCFRYHLNNNIYGGYYSMNLFDKQFVVPDRSNDYNTAGIFFNRHFDKLTLFGEYARIDGKDGIVGGLRWGERPIRQLLLYRHYEKGIPVWHGNPFSAAGSFDNETGVYYGLELRPLSNTRVNIFFDVWSYPETSYFEKMPVVRSERYIQIIRNIKNNRLRLQLKHRDYDKYRVIGDIGMIRKEKSLTCTLDWTHSINSSTTVRSGMQYIERNVSEARDYKQGFLLYQSIGWKYGIFDLMGQINVFDSEISHYLYEYTLQGMWENRPLSGEDVYLWFMAEIRVTSEITIQNKFSYFYSGKQATLLSQLRYRVGG